MNKKFALRNQKGELIVGGKSIIALLKEIKNYKNENERIYLTNEKRSCVIFTYTTKKEKRIGKNVKN